MNVSARVRWIVAALVGLAAVIVLSLASRGTGFARDEGIYFEASRVYGDWTADLVKGEGALERKTRDKAATRGRSGAGTTGGGHARL